MKKLLLILLALVGAMGCDKNEKNKPDGEVSLIGTWVNYYYEVDENLNEYISKSDYWQFNSDGTCEWWHTSMNEKWKRESTIYNYKYYPEEKKVYLRKLMPNGDYGENVEYLYVRELSNKKLVFEEGDGTENGEVIICESCPAFVEKTGGYNPKDIIGKWTDEWGVSYEFTDDKNGAYYYNGSKNEYTYSIDISKNEITFTYSSGGVGIYKLVDINKDYIYLSTSVVGDPYGYHKYYKQ